MSDDKPTFIKISPGANVKGLEATGNTIVGNANFIDNQGTLENAKLEHNRHITPNNILEPLAKSWHERPFGFIVATIFCGLVVALCAYYFGWTK